MDREEFEALLDYVLPLAQDQLGKLGDFAPFAAALNAYGTVDTVTGQTGEGVDADEEVVGLLVKALRHHAHPRGYRAVAICYSANVRQPDAETPFQAIGVSMEHVEGEAMAVYLPYQRDPDGAYRYGDMLGGPRSDLKVFGPSGGS